MNKKIILILILIVTIISSTPIIVFADLTSEVEFLKSRVYYLEQKLNNITVYEDPEYPERPIEVYFAKAFKINSDSSFCPQISATPTPIAPLSDTHICEFENIVKKEKTGLSLNGEEVFTEYVVGTKCKWCGLKKMVEEKKEVFKPLKLKRKMEE